MSVLDSIVAGVREDLEARKRALPIADLQQLALETPAPPSFAAALRSGPKPRIIAEIKRASPSRGAIAPDADAAAIARAYRSAGAAAISVLTEGRKFGGSLEDLARATVAVERATPLLRKDFVVDAYQILEARAAGASAVLLIAALFPDSASLKTMIAAAMEAGVEALVEVHDEQEAGRALAAGAEIIGVNNRDLKTMRVSLETSERLARLLSGAAVRVAESGISTREDVERLTRSGYDAFLVGERLMAENDPGAALRRLLGHNGDVTS
jgi:indole-3-glycerol phosphate synthase